MNKTDWNTWLEELGSELYNSPNAYRSELPQLADLEQYGKLYRSSYKLNGEHRPKRKDKTIILQAAPLVVIEHGDRPQNLITYLEQNSRQDFITIVTRLAGYVGMELPKGDFDSEAWKQKIIQRGLKTAIQDYYTWCLANADGAEVKEVRKYLKSRFSDEETKAMGLGYLPSVDTLQQYLVGTLNYTQGEIKPLLDMMGAERAGKYYGYIGSSHHITIPIYKAGVLDNWIYRHHNQPEATSVKYQYPKGLEKADVLAYIPRNLDNAPDLVLVEGQLDALHLQAAGFKNVVATGGNNISPEQVKDAVKRGCKSLTLLYDADPTSSDTEVNYNHRCRATKVIRETLAELGRKDIRINVADLPQPDPAQKVDPDTYLAENGTEALKELLRYAKRSWHYELEHLAAKYQGKELSQLELDTFTDAVLDIYSHIASPLEQNQYRNIVGQLMQGVEASTLDKMLEQHLAKAKAEEAQKKAAEMLRQASQLLLQGKTAEAQELQAAAAVQATAADGEVEYQRLQHPITREQIIAELEQMPDVVHTGLHLGGTDEEHEILLPAGALSILAAPTSHGKTTMLVSMAVNAAKADPTKKYYLFSYEEALAQITIKALSCWAGLELSGGNRRTIQTYLTTGKWYGYSDKPELLASYQEQEKDFFKVLEEGRLHINYTDAYTETLCSNIRRLAADGSLGAVFIDYVQYLELASSQRNYRRDEEISKICRMLKDVAVDTGTPIVLGAQFNRQVTDPTKLALSNIGEGGDIERKAAYVLGFWNNDMPMQNQSNIDKQLLTKLTKGNTYDSEHPNKNRSITAMVLKNRSGLGAKAGANGLLGFNGNIGSIGDAVEPSTETTDPWNL